MTRAYCGELEPVQCSGLVVQAYTYAYAPGVRYAAMRETVYLDADGAAGSVRVAIKLTSNEARALAAHLLEAAQHCDDHRERRESLEAIEEQLRDEDFDTRLVYFHHPDVVYCLPGQMEATAAANPGKLILSREPEAAESAAGAEQAAA